MRSRRSDDRPTVFAGELEHAVDTFDRVGLLALTGLTGKERQPRSHFLRIGILEPPFKQRAWNLARHLNYFDMAASDCLWILG